MNKQMEEEKTASVIIEQLKLVEDGDTGVLILDSKLGERGKE